MKKKALLILLSWLLIAFTGQTSLAQDEGAKGTEKEQKVNQEIKEASKEVAKESKNIFQKTGRAGKSFWRGVKEGFKETK